MDKNNRSGKECSSWRLISAVKKGKKSVLYIKNFIRTRTRRENSWTDKNKGFRLKGTCIPRVLQETEHSSLYKPEESSVSEGAILTESRKYRRF